MKKNIHYAESYILNPTHPISVNLIGLGGTGSQVLECLARIDYALYKLGHPGIEVTCYDDDVVSEANIGRQLFRESEIGRYKGEVLVSRINTFYGTDWKFNDRKYPYEDCSLANITISCVDNVKARIDIGNTLRRKNYNGYHRINAMYWLDFGNGTDRGQFVLGSIYDVKQPKSRKFNTIGKLLCVDEIFDLSSVNEKDSGPSCSLAEALSKQDLFVNSSLAQLGCNMLWKMFTEGNIDYNGAYVNVGSMNVNRMSLTKREVK